MRAISTVGRQVIGGSTAANPSEVLRQSATGGQAPLLKRAVCVEVFDSPGTLTSDQKQALAEQVNNPEFVDVLPINSILARIISDSSDLGSATSTILFPIFNSSIQFPIIPGEHVWVLYSDPGRDTNGIGYWFVRVSEQQTIEDANFNVHDRRFFPEYNPQLLSTTERGREQQHTPNFPNGADTQQSFSLRITGSNGQNPYDGIYNGSNAIKNFTFEPVPRWSKRPGELVMEGRNNATIILGDDRNGSVTRSEQDIPGFSGKIDIVAGRARKLPESDSAEPEETAPRIITNTREQKEVNKTPYLNNSQNGNPREGDPDYENDAARILVSMQTKADANFKLTDLPFPDQSLEFSQPNENAETTTGKSYVLGKADHIRLISRKTENSDGTVFIVREADEEEKLAFLYMNKEGQVQIIGKELFLGKSTEKQEPYIKWSEYKKSIEKLQSEIDQLKSFCQNLTNTLSTAFGSAIAAPYSPIAALNSQVPSLQSHYSSLEANLAQPKSDAAQAVEDSKSTVIFGE